MDGYSFCEKKVCVKTDKDRMLVIKKGERSVCAWAAIEDSCIDIYEVLLSDDEAVELLSDFFVIIARYYHIDTIIMPAEVFWSIPSLHNFIYVVGIKYCAIRYIEHDLA